MPYEVEAKRGFVLLSELPAFAGCNEGGIPRVSIETLARYKSVSSLMIKTVGNIPCCAVTAKMAMEWQCVMLADRAPSSVNTYTDTLKGMFSQAVARGVIKENPFAWLPRIPEPEPLPARISKKTFKALLSVSGVRERAMLWGLWDTGLRSSEMLGIERSNMDVFDVKGKGACSSYVILGKNSKYRRVYANERATKHILIYHSTHESPYLFPAARNHSKPMARYSLRSILHRLADLAKLPEGTIYNAHSFRHAFAIRMLKKGHDLALVSELMGHSDPVFTAKMYVRRNDDDRKKLFFAR